MRKVIFFNMVTLDGFFEEPHADISWHQVDAAFNDFAIEQLQAVNKYSKPAYPGQRTFII